MKTLSRISVAFAALVMAACAFPNHQGEDEQQRELIEQQNEQERQVAPLRGYWTGTLTRGREQIGLELQITVIPVVSGRTENGRSIFRYDASGVLGSTTDTRYDSINFSGDYQYETGRLTLTSSTTGSDSSGSAGSGTMPSAGGSTITPTSPDYPRLLNLRYDPSTNTLAGPLIVRSGQTVGQVVFRRGERAPGEANIDQEELRYQRLRKQYAPILGSYYGPVYDNNQRSPIFDLCLVLTITDQPSPTGHLQPILQATYTRSDVSDPNLRRVLNVTYSFTVSPRTIRMTNMNPTTGTATGYAVELSGTFSDENGRPTQTRIRGTHNNISRGELGRFDVKRVSACPAPPVYREVPSPGVPSIIDDGSNTPAKPGKGRRGRRRH